MRYGVETIRRAVKAARGVNIALVTSRGHGGSGDMSAGNTEQSGRLIEPTTGARYFMIGQSSIGGDDVIRGEE